MTAVPQLTLPSVQSSNPVGTRSKNNPTRHTNEYNKGAHRTDPGFLSSAGWPGYPVCDTPQTPVR